MKTLLLTLSILYTPIAAAPIIVAVSVPPQATLAKRIGGDHIQVITMVPSGANPHTYDLRPSQLADLSRTQLYIAVGAHFTFEHAWMDRIQNINPDLTIINSSESLPVYTDHDHPDPHFWLSPQGCKTAITNITRALINTDPTHADHYTHNRNQYSSELDTLDIWITQTLANLKTRTFLVYHPAWTHFARTYNLEQIAIEHEGKDPTPKHMAKLIQRANKQNIQTIFVEPQFNTASAKAIASEINDQIIQIDQQAPDPTESLRTFTQAIAK